MSQFVVFVVVMITWIALSSSSSSILVVSLASSQLPSSSLEALDAYDGATISPAMALLDAPYLATVVDEALDKAFASKAMKGRQYIRRKRGKSRQRNALAAVFMHALRLRHMNCTPPTTTLSHQGAPLPTSVSGGSSKNILAIGCSWNPRAIPSEYWHFIAITHAREGSPPLLMLKKNNDDDKKRPSCKKSVRDVEHLADEFGNVCSLARWHAHSAAEKSAACCPPPPGAREDANLLFAKSCDTNSRCCRSYPLCVAMCQSTLLSTTAWADYDDVNVTLPDIAMEHPHNWLRYLASRANASDDAGVEWASSSLIAKCTDDAYGAADALTPRWLPEDYDDVSMRQDGDGVLSHVRGLRRKRIGHHLPPGFVLTAYAYCELKCRSNTLSTLHENTFRSSYHYCFGESVYAHGIPLSRFEMGLRLKGLIAE